MDFNIWKLKIKFVLKYEFNPFSYD